MVQNGLKIERASAWTFDAIRLLAGDVLLERSKSVFGAAIRLVDGHFTHALIYVGGTDFIEAVGSGSRSISSSRFFVLKRENWLLLRAKDQSIAAKAAIEARNLAFKKYNLRGAVNTKIRLPLSDRPEAVFCSQLVAEAYERAGAVLVEGKRPSEVTPNTLLSSKLMQQLAPPLIEVDVSSDGGKRYVKEYLDRDRAYRASPMNAEQRAATKAFAVIRAALNNIEVPKDLERPGNLAELLVYVQALDDSIARPLSDRLLAQLNRYGYFDLAEKPFRAAVEQQQLAMVSLRLNPNALSHAELSTMLNHSETSILAYKDGWKRNFDNAGVIEKIIQRTPFALWKRYLELYRNNQVQMNVLLVVADELKGEIETVIAKRFGGAALP